jgi:hypothetical protein
MPKVKIRFHRSPGARASAVSAKLPFPATAKLRVAQLSSGPRFEAVEPFTPERWLELDAYRPRVLIGAAADLQRLVEQVSLGIVELASVDRALVVLTADRVAPLSDTARVSLWQGFGVPVFELYIGPDNRVLAAECQAHEGWHLEPDTECWEHNCELIFDSPGNYGLCTGLAATIDSASCPCGKTTSRLLNIETIRRSMATTKPRRLAASA